MTNFNTFVRLFLFLATEEDLFGKASLDLAFAC